MRLHISNPLKTLFEGSVREVILPCEDGEATVLDFHQPFVYSLRSGYVKVRSEASPVNLLIKSGVARMKGNELIVLCAM